MRVQHLRDIHEDSWHTPGWGGSPVSSGGVSRVHFLREGAEDWADSQHHHGAPGAPLRWALVDLHQWLSQHSV